MPSHCISPEEQGYSSPQRRTKLIKVISNKPEHVKEIENILHDYFKSKDHLTRSLSKRTNFVYFPSIYKIKDLDFIKKDGRIVKKRCIMVVVEHDFKDDDFNIVFSKNFGESTDSEDENEMRVSNIPEDRDPETEEEELEEIEEEEPEEVDGGNKEREEEGEGDVKEGDDKGGDGEKEDDAGEQAEEEIEEEEVEEEIEEEEVEEEMEEEEIEEEEMDEDVEEEEQKEEQEDESDEEEELEEEIEIEEIEEEEESDEDEDAPLLTAYYCPNCNGCH